MYDKIPDPRDDESEYNVGWRFNVGLLSALVLCLIFWSIVYVGIALITGGL